MNILRLQELAHEIQSRYDLAPSQVIEIIQRPGYYIPLKIFSSKMGIMESVIKYLRENQLLTNKQVAELLNKNPRTTWTSYNKVRDRMPFLHEDGFKIPLRIFKGKCSPLCAIVRYCKGIGMSYRQIADALDRSITSIWQASKK